MKRKNWKIKSLVSFALTAALLASEIGCVLQAAQIVVNAEDVPDVGVNGAYEMQLDTTPVQRKVMPMDNSDWTLRTDLYWLKGDEHLSHQEDNNYSPAFTPNLVYVLEVETQKIGYEVDEIEIRLPYNFDSVSYYNISPVDISIPEEKESQLASNTASYYYLVDEATDELVIKNCKPIPAGTNATIQVKYTPSSTSLLDCHTMEIVAKTKTITTVEGETIITEIPDTNPITYKIDTGIKIFTTDKSAKPIYAWPTSGCGKAPDNFKTSENNYVLYELEVDVYGNQTFDLKMIEDYGMEGEVVYCEWENTWDKVEAESGDGKLVYTTDCAAPSQHSNNGRKSFDLYLVVAYPRVDGENNGILYENSVTFEATANHEQVTMIDENDYDEKSDTVTLPWKDYDFSYSGSLSTLYKDLYGIDGTIEHLESQYDLDMSMSFRHTITGYNYDTYQAEVFDNALYWGFDDYDKLTTRMTGQDYEFVGYNGEDLSVTITGTTVDRTNGVFSEVEVTDPFILQGQVGLNGAWEQIAELTESSNIIPGSLLEGKGYTGLKVITPEATKDKWEIDVRCDVRIFGNSPTFATMNGENNAKEEPYEDLHFINFAGEKVYERKEDGTYTWINPVTTADAYTTSTGLDTLDMATYGNHVNRDYDTEVLSRLKVTGGAAKKELGQKNDAAHEKIDVEYSLAAYNALSKAVPDEMIGDVAIQEGVFYDLLPVGFYYNADKVVYVRGSGSLTDFDESSTGIVPAQLVSVETIDDYKGTDRQLVIFKVKALAENMTQRFAAPDAYNYGSGLATGFHIQFTASISWVEYRTFDNDVNLMAFQKGDGTELANGQSFEDYIGYYGSSVKSYFQEDGEQEAVVAAFQDLNGDQITDTNNTYYDYTAVVLEATTSTEVGIIKKVKSDTGSYSTSAETELGGYYSYGLTFSTAPQTESKNVILYDVLEEAVRIEGEHILKEDETYDDGCWQGTFERVDVASAKRMGVDAIVYYTTQDLSDDNNQVLTSGLDKSVWSTVCPADKTTVTAIAVDLSKKSDGSDFVFGSGESAFIEIHMKAPDIMGDYRYAYNKPAYTATNRSTDAGDWADTDNIGTRVKIKLVQCTDITFQKLGELGRTGDTYDPNAKPAYAPLEHVQFRLYDAGGNLLQIEHSDANGMVTFKELPEGKYRVQEYGVPSEAYKEPSTDAWSYWLFTVEEVAKEMQISSIVTYGSSLPDFQKTEAGDYYVENDRKTTSCSIAKYWMDTPTALKPGNQEVKFIIYRNGKPYIHCTGYSNTYSDLEQYDENGEEYVYTVEEVPLPGFESNVTYYSWNKSYRVTNTMLGVLEISKQVADSLGKAEVGTTYTYTVQIDDAAGTYPGVRIGNNGTMTLENIVFANGSATVTLEQGEVLRLMDLPVDVAYTVTETLGDDYDVAYRTATISGYAQNLIVGDTIPGNIVTGTVAKGALNKVEFTNTYKTGSIKLTKLVEGTFLSNNHPDFDFTVTLSKGKPNSEFIYTHGSTASKGNFDKNGEATVTLALEKQESVLFENLPLETQYEITETAYSADGYVTTVVVDNGKAQKTSSVTGTVAHATEVVYTNTKNASKVTVPFTVEKQMKGQAPTDRPKFTFILEKVGNAPMPLEDEVTITTAGTVSFGAITYTEPGVYQYTLREKQENLWGYTYDDTIHQITITVAYDADGNLVASGNRTYQFANTFSAGSLSVTKEITGAAADINEPFDFHITLKGLPGTYGYVISHHDAAATSESGTVTVVDGVATTATIDLMDGETITFGQLPVGMAWTVAESDVSDEEYKTSYTINGVAQVTCSGSIADGDNTAIVCTNNRDHFPTTFETYVEKDITGDVPLSKEVFTFTIKAIGDNASNTPMPANKTATITGSGIGGFGTLNFDAVGTYHYTIEEEKGDHWGYTYDPTVYYVDVEVKNDQAVTDGNGLYVDVKFYQDAGQTKEVQGVTFVNEFDSGSLVVEKKVTGNAGSKNDSFAMTVTLEGETGTYGYRHSDGSDGSIVIAETEGTATFSLKNGETITFPELPKGMHYVVVETKADTNNYKTSYTNQEGTVGDDTRATITNHRTYEALTFDLEATKALVGNTIYDKPFTFQLEAITENAPMPAKNEITILGPGVIDFGGISYLELGTYQYRLTEVPGKNWGYTYDDTEYIVEIEVADSGKGDGTLSVLDKTKTAPIFTNHYTSGGLTLSKEVTGNAGDKEADFAFTIIFTGYSTETFGYTKTFQDGTNNSYTILDDTGIVTLKHGETIVFAELPVGMTYEIVEADYLSQGYVTTGENITGQISGNSTVGVTYKNHKVFSEIKLDVIGEKELTGTTPLENATFAFTVIGQSPEAPMPFANGEEVQKVTRDGAGSIQFGTITFTEPGTYSYTIQEEKGEDWGYTYDPAVYTLMVKVYYNSSGMLALQLTRTKDAGLGPVNWNQDYCRFTNQFEAGSLEVSQSVTGNAVEKDKDFTFDIKFNGITGVYPYTTSSGDSGTIELLHGKGSITTNLKHGEFIHFTQLPIGMIYDIVEREANQNGYTTSYHNRADTIQEDVEATIINHRDYQSTTLDLEVTNIVSGDYVTTPSDFMFRIEAITENAPMPKIENVGVTGEGILDFGEITYTETGIYAYQITEVKGLDTHYTYDDGVYGVTVTVKDSGHKNGILQQSVLVAKNQEEGVEYVDAQSITFENIYKKPAGGKSGKTTTLTGEEVVVQELPGQKPETEAVAHIDIAEVAVEVLEPTQEKEVGSLPQTTPDAPVDTAKANISTPFTGDVASKRLLVSTTLAILSLAALVAILTDKKHKQ